MHVHVNTTLDGQIAGFLLVFCDFMTGMQAFNIYPVRDDKSVKTEFVTNEVIYQPGIGMTGNAVDFIVSGHNRKSAGVNGFFIRRQMDFPQLSLRYIHG